MIGHDQNSRPIFSFPSRPPAVLVMPRRHSYPPLSLMQPRRLCLQNIEPGTYSRPRSTPPAPLVIQKQTNKTCVRPLPPARNLPNDILRHETSLGEENSGVVYLLFCWRRGGAHIHVCLENRAGILISFRQGGEWWRRRRRRRRRTNLGIDKVKLIVGAVIAAVTAERCRDGKARNGFA